MASIISALSGGTASAPMLAYSPVEKACST
jgi:hypothetical protein